MADALTPVQFHGATLFTSHINGVPHVALRSICEALGLDWSAQRQRINRHPVMSGGVVITTAPSTSGEQETLFMPLDMLNGWLFGISTARVRPELRERLVDYQRECFKVLAAHFNPAAAALPPPPAQAPQFASPKPAQLLSALEAAQAVGQQVQRAVAWAVLTDGADYTSRRWLLSFKPAGPITSLPQVDEVKPGEFVTSFAQMVQALQTPGPLPITTHELAALARACNDRLVGMFDATGARP